MSLHDVLHTLIDAADFSQDQRDQLHDHVAGGFEDHPEDQPSERDPEDERAEIEATLARLQARLAELTPSGDEDQTPAEALKETRKTTRGNAKPSGDAA